MAAYTVLANRYRPRTFSEVVGQDETARVLERALQGNRAAHAYLFSGPRGVGKTSMARILAKAFDCLEGEGAPCGRCAVCRGIDEAGDCLDVVEIDGASHNRVENVRDLIENLRFRPVEARYRIYIVDEVHMLSTAAFNALLKTLEEPPSHAKFILCTTEPLKVPETIRSRCQQFDFRRLTAEQIRGRLETICAAEGVELPDALLAGVARQARGAMRDALSLLDQLITFSDGSPTLDDFQRLTGRLAPDVLVGLVRATLAGDTAAALDAAATCFAKGARAADLLEQLTEVLEGVLVVAAGGRTVDRTPEEVSALGELAATTNVDHAVAMLDVLIEAQHRLRQRHDPRLVVELALLTLARLPLLQPVADMLSRVTAERGPAPGPPVASRAQSTASSGRASGSPPALPVSAPSKRAPNGPAPASPVEPPEGRGAGSSPAAADFGERLLTALGRESRSLRMELSRYRRIELAGDEVVLTPASAPKPGLFDVDRAEFLARVAAAATEVAGHPVRVRLATGAAGAIGGAAGDTSRAATAAEGEASARTPAGRRTGGTTEPERGGGSPRAASAGEGASEGATGVERDIQDAWPGAERVDM